MCVLNKLIYLKATLPYAGILWSRWCTSWTAKFQLKHQIFTKKCYPGGTGPETAFIVCHWEPKDERATLYVLILNVRMVSSRALLPGKTSVMGSIPH